MWMFAKNPDSISSKTRPWTPPPYSNARSVASPFELKILFSIAPIAKNGVQSKVGFFLKKPWGPMSCAELLTWAPNNFILNSTYCSLHRMMFNALTVRWAPFCVLKKCQLFITLKTVKKRVQNGQNMHKIQALKV